MAAAATATAAVATARAVVAASTVAAMAAVAGGGRIGKCLVGPTTRRWPSHTLASSRRPRNATTNGDTFPRRSRRRGLHPGSA
eukprot:5054749-Prymnesium_polylepis.1